VLVAINICPVAATTVPSGGREDCPVVDSWLRGVVGERAEAERDLSIPSEAARPLARSRRADI
jgi:hypothetical protein